ncbi:UNVERIFIED_CONTAM: hypothetical protein NCL1_43009 [Trichonephila clavipes]
MLVREKVVLCLREKAALSTVAFIPDGATSHTANPVKESLIQMFGEEKIISKFYKFPWPLQSSDLTSVEFWLWEKLWWWTSGTYTAKINNLETIFVIWVSIFSFM